MNDFQFENLIKAVKICMKENYCALYLEDLIRKFCPEVPETAIKAAVNAMINAGEIRTDGRLLRLVIR